MCGGRAFKNTVKIGGGLLLIVGLTKLFLNYYEFGHFDERDQRFAVSIISAAVNGLGHDIINSRTLEFSNKAAAEAYAKEWSGRPGLNVELETK